MSTAVDVEMEHHRDETGSRIGMWLFLFTELLLFGGLFLLYSVYRDANAADFHYCATTLDTSIGTLNTLILLTSSLTMVLSIVALKRHHHRLCLFFLGSTIFMGAVFLFDKYLEWSHKISHGLFPGSDVLAGYSKGENLFYGLYYSMTGLHGLHVVVGMGVLTWMFVLLARRPRESKHILAQGIDQVALRGTDQKDAFTMPVSADLREAKITLIYDRNQSLVEPQVIKLDNAGLYWHLVDIIWIFLFPLFYLIS